MEKNVIFKKKGRGGINGMKKEKSKRTQGFTMLELIVVIVVAVVLIAVVTLYLVPYYERTKATKDLHTLDAINKAYQHAISEAANPEDVDLSDTVILEEMGVPGDAALGDLFESEQLEDADVSCFYDPVLGRYGVFAQGQNGYTGMIMDNQGTESKIGEKGDANSYIDKRKNAEVKKP